MKSPAGLNLWAVNLNDGGGFNLWVTTRRRCGVDAARKAAKAVRVFRKRQGYASATIRSITSHGTIDA